MLFHSNTDRFVKCYKFIVLLHLSSFYTSVGSSLCFLRLFAENIGTWNWFTRVTAGGAFVAVQLAILVGGRVGQRVFRRFHI